MANEEYDLEVLLELREKARDEAQDEVAHQIAELERRKQAVRAAEAKLQQAKRKRAEECERFDARAANGDATFGELQSFDNYVRGLKAHEVELAEEIEEAERRMQRQKRAVERAKEDLIEAVKELKAVESHREAWEEEQKVLKQRKQSAAMDEVAARLWRKEQGH